MKNFKTYSVSVMVLGFLSLSAQAQPSPELTRYLDEQIQTVELAVDTSCTAPETAAADASQEDWYLRNFWLRVRPQFGITVAGFTKFQIVPEIEMLVQRPFADGWKAYKPASAP
jgi:hypothetical protein